MQNKSQTRQTTPLQCPSAEHSKAITEIIALQDYLLIIGWTENQSGILQDSEICVVQSINHLSSTSLSAPQVQ